jgi:hypothetical protein
MNMKFNLPVWWYWYWCFNLFLFDQFPSLLTFLCPKKFIMFDTTLVSFWYLVNNCINKDDLKFLKQSQGVNERSNGNRVIFEHSKHVSLIQENKTIKMSRVIRWQLQHGFHDEQKIYSSNGEAQGRVTSTCWVLGYAIMVVHNCRKSRMRWMVRIK